MIIGTAGHIDHGKTALIKALTGIDTDRLKEEKARGMTIELGFAYWPQPTGATVGFVDVPGHERFLHTMLMGAQGIDCALLVIACDDGIMPQTREHVEILSLLGVKQAVVALTKCDKVDESRLSRLRNETKTLLAHTSMEEAEIFAVSSLSGQGIEVLKQHLQSLAVSFQRDGVEKAFRLAIDRVFTLQGTGTVVTGMALSGQVHVGDEVVVSPSGKKARLRAIYAQNKAAERGRAGERLALNLAGVSVDQLKRGDCLEPADFYGSSSRFDVRLKAVQRLTSAMPVRLHCGTKEVGARLHPLQNDEIAKGEWGFAQLVLEQAIAIRVGDRLILRDVSAQKTLAGGIVLDVTASERKRRSSERQQRLEILSQGEPVSVLKALIKVQQPVDLTAFAKHRGLLSIESEAKQANLEIIVFEGCSFGFIQGFKTQLFESIIHQLLSFHAENPDLSGLAVERLRLLNAKSTPAALFRFLIREGVKSGHFVQDGHFLRHPLHSIALSTQDEALFEQILPHFCREARFRPPRVRDFATLLHEDEALIRHLFKRLERFGTLHEVAHDHYFLRPVVAELVQLAGNTVRDERGFFTASAFRDRIETVGGVVGRKVAIQILEFFDHHGVTLRRGDQRKMNPHRLDLFAPNDDK